jgi:homoserine dehydrogenase
MIEPMRIALLGFGSVGRAFSQLLHHKRKAFPFRIVGIHTARQGTVIDDRGLDRTPVFGPKAESLDAFLEAAKPEVLVEITTLNPATGEPAASHIRAAFRHGAHVVTANKGPIANCFAELHELAQQAGLEFRFESTVMDGAPIFNLYRYTLPGVRLTGFTGVLNSTCKLVVEAMREGLSFEDGVRRAQELGIAEADPSYDTEGWDSAAKAAALANVLMDARIRPSEIDTKGIGRLTTSRVLELKEKHKIVQLVARARRSVSDGKVKIRVRAEVLEETDILASVHGTSNLLLFHTDLMGTIGTVSLHPTPSQTAYGLFSDIVDIARTI